MGAWLIINDISGEGLEPAVANADAMLVNWKLHLPKVKQRVVDKNEEPDELLFYAHSMLHWYLHPCSS